MNPFSRFFAGMTLRPQGLTLIAAGFLPVFAIVTMFPIVAAMIQHFSNDPAAASKVPLTVTAPGLTVAVLSPFAGLIVDRFGRRRLLLVSTLLYGALGSAPFLLDDVDQIFATRLLLGACEAGILTIVNTLIADYWDDTGRKNWLFVQGFVGTFFGSAAMLASGLIAGVRWNGGFLIYLVAFPIVAAMLVFIYEPQPKDQRPEAATRSRTPFPWIEAIAVVLVTFSASVLYYLFIVNGSIAFAEIGVRDPAELSRLTYIPSLFVMLGAVIFRILAKRSNAIQLTAFLLFLGTGLAGVGMAKNLPSMILAVTVQQIGAGMAVPTLIAWAQTKFNFEHRGRGMGAWTSAFFMGQFASAWVANDLAQAAGSMRGGFLIAGMIAVASCGAVILWGLLECRKARMAI
ncbi:MULTISPECIES: MFS transporter [unclassified Novosphingobium]|uniref:MFS transporter n=1 Tax=unclassified Novosphingobium TaxID=2644732 RepID=UPI00146BD7AA|nr:MULTISPECIES: MFS transporter [unclassified Novosphingobium]NMN06437.1 MFS family permease [Novosphingobium sp. SG919]NMN89116.1 MFS family permease [Novosphingobium sp. SG916]